MNRYLPAWLAPLAFATNAPAFDSVVVFNEVQYHPAGDNPAMEFVELYNQNTVDVDVSGWRISSGIDYEFVEGTVIPGQSYLVVAADPGALEAAAGIDGVLGPFAGRLENRGERLRLRNRNDRIMDQLDYNDRYPWPVGADGSGATLAKLQPGMPGHLPEFWRASFQSGGTPGARNFPDTGGGPATAPRRIFEFASEWRYNESGEDLGAAWAGVSHALGGDWQSGPGLLAYESRLAAEIGTTLTQPSRNSPYVRTYYFETEFELGQAEFDRVHAITITHQIDDGAVFYLNGAEVLRDNMPGGVISAATLADSPGEATVEGPFEVPLASLQVGTNRISVEVHQASSGSSDIVFGLEADVLELLPDPSAPPALRINEVASAADPGWWIEIANVGPQAIALNDHVLAQTGQPVAEYLFPEETIEPGGFLVVDAQTLGFTPASDERLFLYEPGRSRIIDGVDMKNRLQARRAGGNDEFLSPSAPTPAAANTFEFNDAVVINEIMYHHRPLYPQAGQPPSIELVPIFGYEQVWRYNETGADLGLGWAAVRHPLGGDWLAGVGPLGWETASADLPVALATTISRPAFNNPFVVTHYFETEFEIPANQLEEIGGLSITHMIDDGAVFYLNGQEIGRFELPAGIVQASTLATANLEAAERNLAAGADALVAGTNRLSVEVHQAAIGSSDIVMGLRLAALREIPSETPSVEYVANDEEWLELYNRSDSAVDVSAWEFDRGIDFTFPPGTMIPADGYLVVAKDSAALAGKFPGIIGVGDYSGSLLNRGERVRLVDAAGNPVDEVFYRDDAPWPNAADGGGSSLELRNPDADNSVASAWAASDNSAASGWRNYSFTLTAQNPVYRPGQFNFHELRMGLLDRGELLLDDVSVVEDPGGTNRELIQNSNFIAGDEAWRLLGTHERSEVVNDDGNPVLNVVATARMNYMNNLLETSLKSGGSLVPVQNGTDYRISFRAKWLSGTPQFRFELYYNKLAATVILHQPGTHGTPGAQNSAFEANVGPTIDDVTHTPAVPEPNRAVTVRAKIADTDGIGSVALHYSVAGAAFQTAPMSETGEPGVWSGQIPGRSGGTKMQFYIEASDAADSAKTATFPAAGRESRAMVQVADGRDSGSRQNLRLIMTNSDSSAMHNANDLLQNRRLGCTVITNESEIAYDCGVRLRGSMFSRRNAGGTGLNIKFPSDRLFRGVHKTITTRTSGRIEILAKHIINHAGGLHDNYNDVAQLIHTTQNSPTRLSMARFGQPYLRGMPGGDGADGTVFKMEGIREFQSTTNGNPESQKTPFPIGWVRSFDIADQGDDKEMYRHNMRINGNFAKDDYTSIIAMCKVFSMNGQELEDAAPEVINVDMWMRQFALLSLLGIGDTYTQGNPHNLNFFVRPSDGRVEPMPWDWDFMFNRGTSSSLWGDRNFSKIPPRPVFTRLFHGHLQDLINTTYNTDYMNRWLSHYGSLMGEGYTGRSSYIRDRGNYVLGRLPAEIPFRISSNGGGNFSVDTAIASLRGDAWVNVRELRLEGAPAALELEWSDAETWEIEVPVSPGANPLTIVALDFGGNEVGRDTITVTNTSDIAPANASNLVISEIMYHPPGGAAHEYIELMNISDTATIDLSGVRFVEGIDFSFQSGVTLAPGARLLLVADPAAFAVHHGAGLPVSGAFANGTQLSNSGERLAMSDSSGSDIRRFRYDDDLPWPPAADGTGRSLVLRSPADNPDHSLAENWRSSAAAGGSPGGDDAVSFAGDPAADGDRDGASDLLEHAFGSAADQAGSRPQLSISIGADAGGAFIELAFDVRIGADDVVLNPEISFDLVVWNAGGEFVDVIPGDGVTETQVYRFAVPEGMIRAYGRVSVELR